MNKNVAWSLAFGGAALFMIGTECLAGASKHFVMLHFGQSGYIPQRAIDLTASGIGLAGLGLGVLLFTALMKDRPE